MTDLPPVDAAPLLAFRATFANAATALPSWDNATHPCSWEGVACNASGVVGLQLHDKGIKGTLTPSQWALPDTIQEINLGGRRPLPFAFWILRSV